MCEPVIDFIRSTQSPDIGFTLLPSLDVARAPHAHHQLNQAFESFSCVLARRRPSMSRLCYESDMRAILGFFFRLVD